VSRCDNAAVPAVARFSGVARPPPLAAHPSRVPTRAGLEEGEGWGHSLEKMGAFFAERGRGGMGLMVTGGIAPNAAGRVAPFAATMSSASDARRHRVATDMVHETPGAKIAMQILHAGRYAYQPSAVAPTATKAPIGWFTPKALSGNEIERTVADFANAAGLAQEAGYDGVEVKTRIYISNLSPHLHGVARSSCCPNRCSYNFISESAWKEMKRPCSLCILGSFFWTVFPVSAVVGAAVPAAVCRWGLCPCCPDVGRCLSGVYNHHHRPPTIYRSWARRATSSTSYRGPARRVSLAPCASHRLLCIQILALTSFVRLAKPLSPRATRVSCATRHSHSLSRTPPAARDSLRHTRPQSRTHSHTLSPGLLWSLALSRLSLSLPFA